MAKKLRRKICRCRRSDWKSKICATPLLRYTPWISARRETFKRSAMAGAQSFRIFTDNQKSSTKYNWQVLQQKKTAPSIPHSVGFRLSVSRWSCSAPGDTSKNHRTYGVQRWQPATVAAKVLKRVRCFSSASLVTGAMTQPTLRTSFRLLYLDPYTLENTHVPRKNSGWKTTFLLRWQLFRGRSLVFGGVLLLIPVNPHNTLSTFFCTGLQFFSVCLQIIPSVLNGWKRTNKIETEIPGNKKKHPEKHRNPESTIFSIENAFYKKNVVWAPKKKTERKRK